MSWVMVKFAVICIAERIWDVVKKILDLQFRVDFIAR